MAKRKLVTLQSGLFVLASRVLGHIARLEPPRPLIAAAIAAYSFVYGVNLNEALEPASGYKSLDEFFTRRIEPGARPVCGDADALISPVDGTLIGFGDCSSRSTGKFKIKGDIYDICQLLGLDPCDETSAPSGGFAVFYLHPRDCHRVQVPTDCSLAEVRHIPGSRFPVASWFEKHVEQIYGSNERLVFDFETPAGAQLSLVMVAALGVGNIESQHSPVVLETKMSTRKFDVPTDLRRGEDLASFRLGSTVVLLWSREAVELDGHLTPGPAVIGQRLGTMTGGNSHTEAIFFPGGP